MDGSVLHIVVSTVEVLEMLRPASKDEELHKMRLCASELCKGVLN